MRLEETAFVDVVTGRPVHRYIDFWGRRWLAEGAWSLFRLKSTHNPDYRMEGRE